MKTYNPSAIAAPTGYSHGIELPAGTRLLYIAGQLGADVQGRFSVDFAVQTEQAWRNLRAVLGEAGMDFANLVKITTFLTRRQDIAAYREVRTRVLGAVKPTSTLLVISALAREEALIEIEAVAAAP